MKTTKEKFDDLFSEMADFARSTPLSEIEKYDLFAKNFSNSFNWLYNEIEDIETKREIYDFNFNQDAHLEIALFVWEPNAYEKAEINKNYQSLKRLILNKIPQSSKNKNGSGRKKTEHKSMESYLSESSTQKKNAFLENLKREFIDSTPKEFVYLIRSLIDKKIIPYPGTRKELYDVFEHFFQKKFGTTTSKNTQWNSYCDTELKKSISLRINNLL